MSGKQRAVTLYRSLLKAHKNHLPPEMKALGDSYVRSEFKLHKNAKPEHLTAFFQEWESYLNDLLLSARTRDSLSMAAGVDPSAMAQAKEAMTFGRDLPKDVEFQEEQRKQLEALRLEAEKLGRHDK